MQLLSCIHHKSAQQPHMDHGCRIRQCRCKISHHHRKFYLITLVQNIAKFISKTHSPNQTLGKPAQVNKKILLVVRKSFQKWTKWLSSLLQQMQKCKQLLCPFSVCSFLFSSSLDHKDEITRQHLIQFLISALLNVHNALPNLLIPFLDQKE